MPDETQKKPSRPRIHYSAADRELLRWLGQQQVDAEKRRKRQQRFKDQSEMTRKRLDRIEAAVGQIIYLQNWKPGDDRNPGGTA